MTIMNTWVDEVKTNSQAHFTILNNVTAIWLLFPGGFVAVFGSRLARIPRRPNLLAYLIALAA